MSVFFNQSNFFDPFQAFFENPNTLGSSGNTQMDWKETQHAHIFHIDLPGFTKDDVKLEVHESRVLHLRAERKTEEETNEAEDEKKTLKWHCKERTNSDNFSREFHLPENAKVDEIKASIRDGVLIITVPKDESKKKHKHQKKVEITGDDESHAPKGLSRFVCCKA
ncbi:17.6 kDa class I heat shock protein-like [Quillaja saponaria]|uniref:17.6 kDa class I heat shock protein-like n=1 Tax=Quillaja saponaria TaxID=32244 RepID=A0AAD7PB61_QUISA|nr:17.6 kDa class I heat shock protein-like [Quillaja saponaria]